MTYPTVPLSARLRVAIGADLTADPSTYTWTDITTDVDFSFDVTDKIGSTDDSSESNTSFSCTLRNNDGKYTLDNPESTIWPYWGIGTPLEWSVDNGDGGGYRIQCITYVISIRVEWTANTPHRCVAHVTAAGVFSRLARGRLQSALRRTVPSSKRRKSFWPLEDAAGSLAAASAVSTVGPMRGTPPEFGVASTVPGALSVAKFSTGQTISADFSSPTTSQGVRLTALLRAVTPPSVQGELFELRAAGGSVARYVLEIGAGQLRFRAYAPGGAEVSGASAIGFTAHESALVWLEMDIVQTAAATLTWTLRETTWSFTPAGLPTSSTGVASNTFAGTLGGITGQAIGPGGLLNDVEVGMLALCEQSFPLSGGFAAVLGWAGNTAAGRVDGMCNEFRIPRSVTSTALGAVMGPQIRGSLLDNLRDSASTDHGILTDHTGRVEYTALSELYNRVSALTLRAWSRGEIGVVSPEIDDQRKSNVASASRSGGSTATVRDEGDIRLRGEYEREAITVNVANDLVLHGHAGWALARGRTEHYDIKQLTIKPHVAGATLGATLSTALLSLRLGDRIRFDPLPQQMAKGPVTRQIRGRTQTLPGSRSRTAWEVTYDLIQTEAYDAFVLDTDRLDTAGTEVIVAASSAATVITAQFVDPKAAVTGATSIELWAAGEKVNLTAVADETLQDDYSRVVASGWGSMPASATVPAQPWTSIVSVAPGAASDFATTGAAGTMSMQAASSQLRVAMNGLPLLNPDLRIAASIPVTPTGDSITLALQYRRGAGGGSDAYEVAVVVPTSGNPIMRLYAPGQVLISEVILPFAHVAGAAYWWRVAPINDRHRAKIWPVTLGAEPAYWMIDARDSTRVAPGPIGMRSIRGVSNTNVGAVVATWDSLIFAGVQQLTVTRGLLGFSKALPIGSQVKLWKGRGLGV